LLENNLFGTVNLLEYCRARGAGAILLSTSRVYSLAALTALPIVDGEHAFQLGDPGAVAGLSAHGISEGFSTTVPRSLYGTSKAASEDIALEYAEAFGVRVFINRCGVLAGAGQFARPDQGIFAYWIHSWAARRPLTYLGFNGHGHQVRDVLHPRDLVPLLDRQMQHTGPAPAQVNVSGGMASACSLRQCSDWCAARLGPHQVAASGELRRFDVPWLVLDSREAQRHWGWAPATSREAIFEEIAAFAAGHPEWLDRSAS
jgi:CDP-paratose 2-epimerase